MFNAVQYRKNIGGIIYMKKFRKLKILMFCLVLATSSTAVLVPPKNLPTAQAIVHSYSKTVTRYYGSISSVEESIFYSEYNMYSDFKGTLYLQSVERSGSGYIATFTGTLVGII